MNHHSTLSNGALRIDAATMETLLRLQGPSLGLWRAAEVAALRKFEYPRPILDLGCGDGLVASHVVRTVEVGVDLDPAAVARARATGIYRELIDRAVQDAGIAEGSIGTVFSNSVLEHVPDLPTVLQTAFRLLREGGWFVLTAPTERFGSYLSLPLQSYAGWRNRQLGHLNLWTEEMWRGKLDAAGFRVVTTCPYLRRPLVWMWDSLELLQQVEISRTRCFGRLWRRLPKPVLSGLARTLSRLDLSSPPPGGGRLILAVRK